MISHTLGSLNSGNILGDVTPGIQRLALLLFVTAILPFTGSGQDVPQIQPKEVFSSASLDIEDAALSPDKRWIAFAGSSAPQRNDIYIIPSEGGDAVPVTRGVYNDHSPAWAPDGRAIFFFSNRIEGAGSDVYHLMRLDFDPERGAPAGTVRPLSMEGFSPSRARPVSSPDGTWVAYGTIESAPDPNESIRVVPSSGGASREITRIRFLYGAGLGWTSDSRFVIWDETSSNDGRERGLYRVPIQGGPVEQVLSREGVRGIFGAFSGDGRRLLWEGGGTAEAPLGPGYLILASSGAVTGRVTGRIPGTFPSLSIDGSSGVSYQTVTEPSIQVRPFEGGEARAMLEGCNGDLIGWTDAGLLLVEADSRASCGLVSGQAEEGEDEPTYGGFLLDPTDGSIQDISSKVAPALRRGYLLAIHPDGRHVLAEHWEGSREEGTFEVVLQIVDLLTGEIQTVSRSESSAWGFSLIYGNQGQQTDGDPDPVEGDRFLFTLFQDGARRLYSVRPGEEPETLWTYPEEIILTVSNPSTDPMGMPVGVHGSRIAWVRTNANLDFVEVTPDTRSTLMVTDYATGETWEVLTLEGYLVGPLWSRDGTRVALEYQTTTEEKRHIVVADLTDGGHMAGDPLILDVGREVFSLGGWSADDRSLLFQGGGVPGQNRWSYFRIDVAPGAVPVNLTADDPNPSGPGMLSPDGSLLVYPARRVAGSAIYMWDLPTGDEGR